MNAKTLLLSVALLTLAAPAAGRARETVSIKIGHTGTADHHYQMYLEKFADAIADRTRGRYRFTIYPSDLYGRPDALIEGCRSGGTDMVLATGSLLTAHSPKYGVLNLPFLFNNSMEACEILNGPIGREIEESLAESNLIVLGWWENGMRHLFPGRPVGKPEDLAGMRLRVIDTPEMIDTINAFGAVAVPMGFNDVYSAWRRGIIDGCEGTFTHMLTQKYYELTKSAVLLGYMHVPNPLVASKRLWDSIPERDRAIFLEEAAKMSRFSFEFQSGMDERERRRCETLGVLFTSPDRQPFIDAVHPVWDKYRHLHGGMLDRILTAVAELEK